MSEDDTLIPLSALQHYVFCPRQCALIHVEQAWAEDAATAKGRLLHDKVDAGGMERRGGLKTARSVYLRSDRLGLFGVADVVEFRENAPYPVEYKLGKPKTHRADEVQLCAQGVCLEEMFGKTVSEGALFYGTTRRRQIVPFDDDLRGLTERTAAAVRAMIAAGTTPAPVPKPACKRCSLIDLCTPQRWEKPPSIAHWLKRQVED
jgi:CRISPR-associated exonuclease Cas4